MRDGFVDGQLEDDLVADKADEVVLGIGRAHFGDETVGIIGADDKTNDGAGVTEDGFLNFFRQLGGILISQDEVEAKFAGFGKDLDKRSGSEVLKFIDVEKEVFSLFFGDMDTVHGGDLELADDHGAQKGGVVLPDFALGQIQNDDLALIHHLFEVDGIGGVVDDISDGRTGDELADFV